MKNVRIRLLGFSVHQTEIICISTVNSIWLHLLLQNYKIASSIGKSVHHAQRCTERTPGNLLTCFQHLYPIISLRSRPQTAP